MIAKPDDKTMFELPWTVDEDRCVLGKKVADLVKTHGARLDHKLDNLIAKKSSTTAMTQVSLEGSAVLDMQEQLDPIKVSEEFDDILRKPWIWTSQPYTWEWDFNAWPMAGFASVLTCMKGDMCTILLDLSSLKGLTAISALSSFLDSDPFSACPTAELPWSCLLKERESLVIPFGHIPLVFGYTDDDDNQGKGGSRDDLGSDEHIRAMVNVVGTSACKSSMSQKERSAVKAYIESEVAKQAESKLWHNLTPACKTSCATFDGP